MSFEVTSIAILVGSFFVKDRRTFKQAVTRVEQFPFYDS